MFLDDFGPKWSGKAPNGIIMGGKYSQTTYGDFWTDSGTNFFRTWRRTGAEQTFCLNVNYAGC